jgi:hypothetical protein
MIALWSGSRRPVHLDGEGVTSVATPAVTTTVAPPDDRPAAQPHGSRLVMRMQPIGARAVTLRPTVVEATPGHRLRWQGRLGMPGIFDAEHSLTITPREEGGVRLSQEERFTGVLVPLMARSLDRHTQPAFEAMNAALKHRAERRTVAQHG